MTPKRTTAASSSLLAFTLATKPDYAVNWHHRLICNRLDRLVSGELARLMIFTPPRMGKSELVSRRLPAYILGRMPSAKIIAASYGADLARQMNRDVQRIMDDPAYWEIFPGTRLNGTNIRTVAGGNWLRNADMFEVVGQQGYYRGAGVGGAITGLGMDFGLIDDPLKNRQDANSQTIRDRIWDWYTSTFRTRLAPGGRILVTMTRWHEDDLAGRLLDLARAESGADQWEVINLPAIAEEPVAAYDIRQPGEALWVDRFDLQALQNTRMSLGSYDWNALYMQRPAPPEGGMFKRDWFQIVGSAPRAANRVRYWDKAGTEGGEGAATAGVLIACDEDGVFYIEDVIRGRYSALQREQIILQTAELDAARYEHVIIWIEQEPGSGGKESAESTVRSLAGFDVHAERVTGDKLTRALPFAAQCEARNVRLVKGEWNMSYLGELANFPFGMNKDQVDASSGAFNKLVDNSTTVRVVSRRRR